jgi:hypothetical protein
MYALYVCMYLWEKGCDGHSLLEKWVDGWIGSNGRTKKMILVVEEERCGFFELTNVYSFWK